MKKKLLIFTFLILLGHSGFSQDGQMFANNSSSSDTNANSNEVLKFRFKSYKVNEEPENIPENLIGEHPFGEEIARKNYLLDKKYVKEEELAPGNPATKIVLKKPEIYDSVKSIERDLKRAVKRNEISLSEAAVSYSRVLEVALNIIAADTGEFELLLGNTPSTKLKLEIFTKRVEIYF